MKLLVPLCIPGGAHVIDNRGRYLLCCTNTNIKMFPLGISVHVALIESGLIDWEM